MLRPSRISEERAKELDNADKAANCVLYKKGQRPHKAEIGAVETFGPLIPIVLPPGRVLTIPKRLREDQRGTARISYG